MTRRSLVRLLALSLLALALPATASADVPVHVRLVKASRQGPAKIDPKLSDLQRQISKLAWVSWEQVHEQNLTLQKGKTAYVNLPDGDTAGLTLQEEQPGLVTIEVAVVRVNLQARMTSEKNTPVLYQVKKEKAGTAYFMAVKAWPEGK